MSQSYFSLEFLSQNSLWKLSTFCGYKGYLYWCVFRMRKVNFSKQSGLVTWPRDWIESRVNCLANLGLLSCSATTGVTLQLLCMLHTCASFGDLPLATSYLRDLVASPCRMHTSELFFTLSHTLLLHDSHLNTGFLNVEL